MKKILFIILFFTLTQGGEKMKVFNSPGGFRWFPGNREALEEMVGAFFAQVPDSVKSMKSVGAIAPHAGYAYCGLGNAYSYANLIGSKIERVFVLGLSHRYYLKHATLLDADMYKTPLGQVPIDQEIIGKLAAHEFFKINNEAFYSEHSLDNQIPFIQYALKNNFKLVPIMIGDVSLKDAAILADQLKPYLNDKTFFAISSDFTHYGGRFQYTPFPNDSNVRENLEKLDMAAVKYIENLNVEGFNQYIDRTGATICGRNPILTALCLFNSGGYEGEKVHYYCSGDDDKDYELSVSYVSLLFVKMKPQ